MIHAFIQECEDHKAAIRGGTSCLSPSLVEISMGIEIERKFLVRDKSWRTAIDHSVAMRQGYLTEGSVPGGARASVRVRIAGAQAWLNVKQAATGMARAEFEYPIPLPDAEIMLGTLCGRLLEKTRHYVRAGATLFEVDEFAGENAGLVVAEVELPTIGAPFAQPAWLGGEVTDLRRYYNVALAEHPYRDWSMAERAAGDAAC